MTSEQQTAPTPSASEDRAEEIAPEQRLRESLGGVQVGQMRGDNLAIALCTYFENPDQESDDETGWTPDATDGYRATINAIHAHYAPALSARDETIARLTRERDEAVRALEQDPARKTVSEQLIRLYTAEERAARAEAKVSALEARLAVMGEEQEEAKRQIGWWADHFRDLQEHVTSLTETLARMAEESRARAALEQEGRAG